MNLRFAGVNEFLIDTKLEQQFFAKEIFGKMYYMLIFDVID